VTAATELRDLFPNGALVKLYNEDNPSDPPAHHVAGLFPVSGGGVAYWDSDVDGLDFVTPRVVDLEVLQAEPVLLVRATLERAGSMLLSANVPERRWHRNQQLRAAQAPMAHPYSQRVDAR
jgi:hypothetical protein